MTATKTKTPAAPVAIPKLTDHEPYAAALAKLAGIGVPLAEKKKEMRRVEAAIHAARHGHDAAKKSAREEAIESLIAGDGAGHIASLKQCVNSLEEQRGRLLAEIDLHEEAVQRVMTSDVLPTRRDAIARFAMPLQEQVWGPCMESLGVGLATVLNLLAMADRFVDACRAEEMTSAFTPDPICPGLADRIADQLRELIRDGYLSKSHPALAGTVFAK